jgi:hypothetical protein
MTPNHDHATLFVAPSEPSVAGATGGSTPADSGTEAMRQLRHPFAIRSGPPAATEPPHAQR